MDNITRFYKAQWAKVYFAIPNGLSQLTFKKAYELAQIGEREEARDMCYELRLQADLSLYRRALVNSLLSCLVDWSEKEKFANEAIDLCYEIRIRQGNNPNLDYIEDEARKLLSILGRLPPANPPAAAIPMDYQTANNSGDSTTSSSEQTVVPWQLEGLYTSPEARAMRAAKEAADDTEMGNTQTTVAGTTESQSQSVGGTSGELEP